MPRPPSIRKKTALLLLVTAACTPTRLLPGDDAADPADTGQQPPEGAGDTPTADTKAADTAAPVDASGSDTRGSDTGGADTSAPGTATDTGAPAPPPPAARVCGEPFELAGIGDEQAVFLAGEFNQWSPSTHPLTASGGVWRLTLDTTALSGSFGYKFVVDTGPDRPLDWRLDPANPMRKIVDGQENSKVLIPDCRVPLLEVESLEVSPSAIQAVVRVRDGADQPGIDAASAIARHGFDAVTGSYDPDSQRFFVHLPAPPSGKHSLLFEVANSHGPAEPLYLPVWVEDAPFDWRDAVLYFALTDRFADGDPAVGSPDACLPAGHPANWRGGDWAGVRQKIEQGYFSALGVDAIWLTAVVDNPPGCFQGLLGKQYTSYHGYFPSAQKAAEGQLGSLYDLKALVAAAHERGIRVLVDLVANHLHDTHPLVAQHPEWFHPWLSCGGGGFDTAPIQCWFESYLPDLNYEVDAAVEQMTEAAIWWVQQADLDGFRIDAVKHMHDDFLRTLGHKLKRRVQTVPNALFWTVGETFTGDWGGGSGPNETAIKKYVAPHLLHGQFDFPMYWRLLQVFARDEASPLSLLDLLQQSWGWYGPGAIMSNFVGNHDVPRFISHASGDIADLWGNGAKEQGWDARPQPPSGEAPYARLRLAWSLLFTIDGVPMIYYGDEIGLPGAGDPDNRRVMEFDGWSVHQQGVFDHLAAMAQVRRDHPALSRGSFTALYGDDEVMAFERALGAERLAVVLNRAADARVVALPVGPGAWTDALSGQTFSGTAVDLPVTVPARGTAVLVQDP